MAGRKQPPPRGSLERPYSALNLRLVLASFGLVSCAALSGVAWWIGLRVASVALAVVATVALVDIVVIQRRRAARRREDHEKHSLFE